MTKIIENESLQFEVFEDGSANVVKCETSLTGDLAIPAFVKSEGKSYPVVSIGNKAFLSCIQLTRVTLPPGIKSVAGNAFLNCCGLECIAVSEENPYYKSEDGLLLDKEGTRLVCCPMKKAVGEITLPEHITSIGEKAFQGCSWLTGITLPEGVREIGANAFKSCRRLEHVIFPQNLTRIGASAFNGCTKLTDITIPGGVSQIDRSAFEGCSGLTCITISGNIAKIENEAFLNCPQLKTVILSEGVKEIGYNAFARCSKLTSITIPEGVTKIGCSAFDGCVELVDITLPESLVEIGPGAFCGCAKLTSIRIPESVTEIGCNAFDGCISLAEVTLPEGLAVIETRTFKDCTGLTKIVIPKGVTKIEGSAFKNCVKLADVNIPKGVTKIGWNVFENCRSLTKIVIPEGVTEIDDRVFEKCENLKSVKIPKSLKKIGSGAFRECVELSDIKFQEDGIQIGDEAFKDCFKLPRVIFSTNKKEISRWEFYRRTYLRTVNIPDNIEEIGGYAFKGCKALAYISISKNVSSIGERIFDECPSLKDISVDEENKNYKSIGGILVNKKETKIVRVPAQKELGHFSIPETIREIEAGAFEDCKNLLSLTIPAKVAKIVPDALWGCNNLEHIEVDENNPNYRSIEGVLFTKDGTRLIHYPRAKKTKEYILPGSVVTVLKGAISNPHLKKVFIPGEVRLIEEQAFTNCDKLEEVIIASSSVVVQPLGFWSCYNLKHLVILEEPKQLTGEADRYERIWRREWEERRELLYKPNFQTWGFKDCGLQNVFVPLDIRIRQGYYEGFCFSFHCFRKLFRYKVEPEKEGGKLIIKVLKSKGPEHVQDNGEINAEYRKDISTGEISIIDYHCTNEAEQEANLEQIKYLLETLSGHGRI